jgi:hypothetical protein
MHQILPLPLWLGHEGEGRDLRRLFDSGIRALVELAVEDPSSQPPREVIHCRFPLVDGSGNSADLLFLAISTVATLLRMHIPTLVSCGAGVSRAPAIAAAAMAMAHEESPEGCLQRIVQQHPSDVSPGFWKEVTAVLPTLR